jgi:hypothetical protein
VSPLLAKIQSDGITHMTHPQTPSEEQQQHQLGYPKSAWWSGRPQEFGG